MAGWQVEQGTAHGRGFAGADPNGLLAKFYTWVTKAYAAGGPLWYIHDDQSGAGSNQYIVVTDTAAPAVNDIATGPGGLPPKFIKIGKADSQAGYIQMQYYLWWNNSTHTGYGLYAGWIVGTYDDADFEYRFRGGEVGLAIHTRLGSAWYQSGVLDWEGDSNLVEGTDKYGTLQAGVTAGSSVVLQLDTGEAANFTDDKYYYIFDYNGHTWTEYVKCTNVDLINDQITVGALGQNFPSGSVIASYAHRCAAFGGSIYNANNFCYSGYYYAGANIKIPYCSSIAKGNEIHNQSGRIYGSCSTDIVKTTITRLSPDDYGYRAVMRPIIVETTRENDSSTAPTTSMNRAYGQLKNAYFALENSRVYGSDGLVIGGNNYLALIRGDYFGLSSSYDLLLLDSTSVS